MLPNKSVKFDVRSMIMVRTLLSILLLMSTRVNAGKICISISLFEIDAAWNCILTSATIASSYIIFLPKPYPVKFLKRIIYRPNTLFACKSIFRKFTSAYAYQIADSIDVVVVEYSFK